MFQDKLEKNTAYLALIKGPSSPQLEHIVALYRSLGYGIEAPVQQFWDFFDYVQIAWVEEKNVETILHWY